MKQLREIKREVYGRDGRSINKHEDRTFEDEALNRYILCRTLDGVPPFFEAYGPFVADHEGLLPRLRIHGREYWGNGWTWSRALTAFCRELGAHIGN